MSDNKLLNKTVLISMIGLGISLAYVPTAAAYQTSLADGTLEWNNIVRYNLGMRMEKPDAGIRTNPATHQGTSSYDRYDIVTNRVDLYSELSYDYQGSFGFRLSGAAWYDEAFNSTVKTGPGLEDLNSYDDNRFSSTTRRYHRGPSGELLDAFAYKNFALGNVVGDIKVGRQTNLWGEAVILTAHSVSHSQAPVDGLKASVAPGADAREISMPVGQVHATLQATPNLSFAAQYFFEWEPTRLPEGGTYLSSADFLLKGPDQFAVSPTTKLRNQGIEEADDTGEWGIAARYYSQLLDGSLGFYYREFSERAPSVSLDFAGGTYRSLYPENAKLAGVSFSKLIGKTSFAVEVVRREDTPLISAITDGSDNVARGNTWHLLLNGIRNFGPNDFWSTATLIAEIGFVHLDKVTDNRGYLNLCGDSDDVERGCLTRNASVATVRFNPQWTAVAPGWDLGLTTALTYGLYGNSVVSGGGNEKAGSYSFGPTLTYNANHTFSLQYIDYLATNKRNPAGGLLYSNGPQLQDRGWLSFTYTGQF